MNTYRPDPDALLAAVQKEETRRQRGRLKIFLGMAAGVGKTYAMLEAAQKQKADGVDVVVGLVETHGRPETEALLDGLELIPRRRIVHRGALLEEMDTDAILARRPQLALVDELAHTNAAPADESPRHRKRYQDVLELLEAGIDVYTTVNVQHFESRADVVRQITGIAVHETVPDSILDAANELELIDLAPEALRSRLAEGKVYTPERVEVAAHNFFRIGNLTALREMALRLTAEHVDHQLRDYMTVKHIAGPWKSGERLMVAVGPSPFSEQLIRWTRRMAYTLEAPWLAVHVETTQPLSPAQKETLARNVALARQLGGEVVVTAGEEIAEALLHLAHQRNVSQIVVGKPLRSPWYDLLRGGSPVDRLIRTSGDIDIYVVTRQPSATRTAAPRPMTDGIRSQWEDYLWAAAIVAVTTVINLLLLPWFGYRANGLIQLLIVQLIAVYIGRGPAILAATISALSWNFLFMPPQFTFFIHTPEDTLLFLLYFALAIVTGNLTARLRAQERQARHNADRTMALYTLAHGAAVANALEDVLRTAVAQVGQSFDAEVALFLSDAGKMLGPPHPCSTLTLDEKEQAVANWVFAHGRPAGRFTESLPLARATYLPLLTTGRVVGVMGIRTRGEQPLRVDQEVLLETFASHIALVIERELLNEAAQQAATLRESERLYTTLLNSISHELRTPLSTIRGAAGILLDPESTPTAEARSTLLDDIQGAADRLNRLVENLLDMSRLDAGRLQLKREWCDVSEVIGVAVKRLEVDLADHPLTIRCPPDLPLVWMDFALIEQVLVNLLDNACRYTEPGAAIEVMAQQEGASLVIRVTDHGPGVPPHAQAAIFDKFYRIAGSSAGGTGLGLSICRGIVEAHGGALTLESAPGRGARFVTRLPAESTPPPVQEATPHAEPLAGSVAIGDTG
ncbi:MAG: sensor histidine kinase KdpD [Caldilineaceae bacterium]|nr:sensor histidine kinase KdpD [Caldilineaceae bacterium]